LFGLGESGELAAKFYHILCGLLVGLALYGFCRSYFSKKLSLLAVALFLTVPTVVVILPWAYVDLIFCLYSFLALLALLEFFKTGSRQWTWLAGVMAGAACATKYTGLQLLLLLVLFTLVEHLTAKRKGWPAGVTGLIIGAVPIALLYPLRNFYFTGWPLFPFQLGSLSLHPGVNWDLDRTQLYLRWLSSFGTFSEKGSVWDSLAAPVLVFVRGRFGEARFYDGVIGPVFLLAPISLARGIKNREVKLLYLFSSLFLLYWAFTTKQVRFLLPVLPVLSFLVVSGLTEWRNRAIQVLTIILVVLGLVVGIEQGIKSMSDPSPLRFWLGRETRDQYLGRRLDVYAIYEEANHALGPGDQVYLVDMKNYGYYLNCRWRADFIFEDYSLSGCLDKAAGSGDILDFFRSLEITHLLINEGLVTDPTFGLKPRPLTLLKSFMHDHASLLARDVYGHALYKLTYKDQ
jgi:4-amino-4-deoxy-L-arabinose transferase-like glycosyltransferase